MDCKKVELNLIDYFYKDLNSDNYKFIQYHLDCCDSCRALYKKMSEVLNSNFANADLRPNDFLSTRIISRIENKKPLVSKIKILQYFLRPALVVSLVALGIFTGIKISNNYSESISANLDINNNNNLSTQFASENYLTIPNDEYLEMYLNDKK